jgi:hypothetical protein
MIAQIAILGRMPGSNKKVKTDHLMIGLPDYPVFTTVCQHHIVEECHPLYGQLTVSDEIP